jgi:D-arabinose 1-dehydrogenase-like Zn-dependent alcohol dehydrogenase
MLKPEGKFCFVGLPPEPVSFKAELLADFAQKSIVGNYIGSRADVQDMLNFSSKHNIKAHVEVFPMEKINDAIAKMRKHEIPFSLVLTR